MQSIYKVLYKFIKEFCGHLHAEVHAKGDPYMERYEEELKKIKAILLSNPQGLTVTDISKEISVNRNSVAKYLDVLLTSGQVEKRNIGPAKLFNLSHRIPTSALMDFSSDRILVLDEKHTIIQVNKRFLTYLKKERENIVGQNFEKIFKSIIKDSEFFEHVAGGEEKFSGEIEFKDGSLFDTKIIPSIFQDGTKGITIILEDITERKMKEEELEENKNLFQAIIDASSSVIYVKGKDGKHLFANKMYTKVTNLPNKKIIGKTNQELFPKQIADRFSEADDKVLKTKKPVNQHEYIDTPEGLATYLSQKFPIKNKQGEVYAMAGISTDITPLVKTQQKLEESEARYKALVEKQKKS